MASPDGVSSPPTILTIPDELTFHIWSFVDDVNSGPQTPYIISSVCRLWRDLAVANPVLWAKTLVTMEDVSHDLRTRLERSKGAPLAVRVIRFSDKTLNVLLEHAERWDFLYLDRESYDDVSRMIYERSLEATSHPEGAVKGTLTTPRATSILPNLKRLTLDLGFFMKDENITVLPIFPRSLIAFSVTCRTIRPFPSLLTPPLRELDITCNTFDVNDVELIFTQCPDLERFNVNASMFQAPGPSSSVRDISVEDSGRKVPLMRKLREAGFTGPSKMALLKPFCSSAPNLQSLRLKPPLVRRTSFFSGLIIPFNTPVPTLHIDIGMNNFSDFKLLFTCASLVQNLWVKGVNYGMGLKAAADRPNMEVLLAEISKDEVLQDLRELKLQRVDCRQEAIIEVAKKMARVHMSDESSSRVAKPRIVISNCVGLSESVVKDPIFCGDGCEEKGGKVEIFIFNPYERSKPTLTAQGEEHHKVLMQAILARAPTS